MHPRVFIFIPMKTGKGHYNATASFIYKKCLKEWWPALDTNQKIIHYKKGEAIFTEGNTVEGVFFILHGVAKVHKRWDEEKGLTVRLQVKARVATTLKVIEKKFGKDEEGFIGFTIARQDIAAYTGAAYETAYKLLTEFTESGYIKIDGKRIAIMNPEGLTDLAK